MLCETYIYYTFKTDQKIGILTPSAMCTASGVAGFQQKTDHRDNTSMSSMAPVYGGGGGGKQIHTMHSTVVYTYLYT